MNRWVFILITLFAICKLSYAQELELRDPTRPNEINGIDLVSNSSVQISAQGPNAVLSAIFIRPNFKLAIINGEKVYSGQEWQGYLVAQIHRSYVVLMSEEKEWEVALSNAKDLKIVKDNEL